MRKQILMIENGKKERKRIVNSLSKGRVEMGFINGTNE